MNFQSLIYALDKNGNLIHIDDVPNGLACECTCPNCHEKLEAKNGGTHRQHHFAHHVGSNCVHGYESSLHLLAKKILSENKNFKVPKSIISERENFFIDPQSIAFEAVELEKKHGSFTPDITLTQANGRLFFIEIFVTHLVDDEKRKDMVKSGISSIEIDLSDTDHLIDEEELRKILIEGIENKEWVFNRVAQHYSDLLMAIAEHKPTIMRGFAIHTDLCPIDARIWKGKSYANVTDDCMYCEHRIEPYNPLRIPGSGDPYHLVDCIGWNNNIDLAFLKSIVEVKNDKDGNNTIFLKDGSSLILPFKNGKIEQKYQK